MDIRLEVILFEGVWTVTNGPELRRCVSLEIAIAEAIRLARKHHLANGDRASVYVWRGPDDTMVFDSERDNPTEAGGQS